MKKTLNALLKPFGYQAVKLDEDKRLWFNYSTFVIPGQEEILAEFSREIEQHSSVALVGISDISRRLAEQTRSTGRIACIVEAGAPEGQPEAIAGIPVVSLAQAKEYNPAAWLVCDPERGYKLYKLLRDQQLKPIIGKSLFHKGPWELADFYDELHADLANMPETMVDDARLLVLAECVRRAAKLNGDIVEIGSYRGGTAYVIASTLKKLGITNRKLTLIDWYQLQSAEVTYDSVKQTFAGFGFVEILSGSAEELVPAMPAIPLSFVHIDINGDMSVIEQVLPVLYERLVLGGMILFDNYYFRYFSKYNFDLFAQRVNEHILLMPSIPQGLLIKSAA